MTTDTVGPIELAWAATDSEDRPTGVPEGWKRVEGVSGYVSGGGTIHETYTNGVDVVMLGDPGREDESHNCDEMGCLWNHVLVRLRDTFVEVTR